MSALTEKTRARFERLLDMGYKVLASQKMILDIGFVDKTSYMSWRVQAEAAILDKYGNESIHARIFRNAGAPARASTMASQIGVIKGILDDGEDRPSEGKERVGATTSRKPSMTATRPGIFFSHATADKAVTDDFVSHILEGGIGIPPKSIFYSSSPDQGVPTGHDFIPYIKKQLKQSSMLIAWITPQYLESSFCMCELGAAWALLPKGKFIPLVHGISFDKLPPPFSSTICLSMASKEANTSLNRLRDDVTGLLNLTACATERWERHRNSFFTGHL